MAKVRIISIVLLLVVAVNALLAGYSFITDPSGHGVKASVSVLQHSPFNDFFIPGLILFTINGILNLIAAITLLCKWQYGYLFLVFQGLSLSGWILIQVFMLREFNILHAIFDSVGIFFIIAGLVLHQARYKR